MNGVNSGTEYANDEGDDKSRPNDLLPREHRAKARQFRAGFHIAGASDHLAVVALLIGLAIPSLAKAKAKAKRISCVGHLKSVGLAHRIFAMDHADLFVWETNFHKLRDLTPGEQIVRVYQTLSNELSTPKILACPADTRKAAKDWNQLTTNNLSYFVGVGASETFPQSFLSGDRNLTVDGKRLGGRVTVPVIATNLAWDGTIHQFQGSAAMGDGSVQLLSTARLREQFQNTGTTNNTFLFP